MNPKMQQISENPKIQQIADIFQTLSFYEMNKCLNELNHIKDNLFRTVYIKDINGDVSKKLAKETRRICFWIGEKGSTGINNIVIPKDEFTWELFYELQEKYNNFEHYDN